MSLSSIPIRLISIEGNIGSGKSTFLHMLRKYSWDVNVEFVPEPVTEWEKIKDTTTNMTMLEMFYGDQERNAFSFQMMAYITRLSYLRNSIERVLSRFPNPTEDKPVVLVMERCLDTDRNIFAKMLYDDGKIREVDYQIYMKWFDEFIKDLPNPTIVYVNTAPEICSVRIRRRMRSGEEGIPLEYLNCCHKYHEEWIHGTGYQVIELNGNDERDNSIVSSYDDWISKVEHIVTNGKIMK